MSTHRHFDKICVAVLILTLAVTILFMNGESLGITVVPDRDRESYTGSEYFTENDLDADWSGKATTTISLNGSGAKVSGSGAYADSGSVTIVQSGYYVVSGTLDDGNLIVDAKNYSKVWILLDGVTITSSGSACIDVEQADKVFLTLAEGSQNTLNGASSFSTDAEKNGIDAALFSRDDLTVNGSGTLTVTAPYRHGIAANDDLVITGGTITVNAARDAIHVNNSFRMTQAELTLQAQDEGIDVDETDGTFYVADGSLSVSSTGDGIRAEGTVTIDGGDITIETGDDGIRSGVSCTINGGTVSLPVCYEGIEAPRVEIAGGEITIHPDDDGINANGINSFYRPMAQGNSASGNQEPMILISGGSVTIVNNEGIDADGLDSNGSIYITGGNVFISMADTGSNCAVDFASENGGVAVISGGTLIACGSSGMAKSLDPSSTQCAVLCSLSTGVPGNTPFTLKDTAGKTLLSQEIPYRFASVLFSCDAMTVGETYRVVIGENEAGITLSGTSESFGDTVSDTSGGPADFGGMQQPVPGAERPDNAQQPVQQRPEMPGVFQGGERPQMQNGMQPAPPNGERPDLPAGADGSGPQIPDTPAQQAPVTDTAQDTADDSVPLTPTAWILIAASALVLIAGIVIAFKARSVSI